MKPGVDVIECANCGRVIGKLETPRVFQEQAVCATCMARLSPDGASAKLVPVVPAPLPPDLTFVHRLVRLSGLDDDQISPLLRAGRAIFGCLFALLFVLALIERQKTMGRPEDYIPWLIISATLCGLTFVKRAV